MISTIWPVPETKSIFSTKTKTIYNLRQDLGLKNYITWV